MPRIYFKHLLLSIALMALGWLAVYLCLYLEPRPVRPPGEGGVTLLVFSGVTLMLSSVAGAIAVAGLGLFWWLTRRGVTARLRLMLVVSYLPLLGIIWVNLQFSFWHLSDNLYMLSAIFIELGFLACLVLGFPRGPKAFATAPVSG
ncbi:hypothetical protein [Pseudomonas purpurea]|uniref:hypothetical protein n=1 Tax=Pseudomonas purpurea TaxID=3136737 RepID=UPI003266D4C8